MPFRRTGTISCAAVVEKPRLFRRADQLARQRPCRHTALFIQFTQVRYRLLDHA